MSIIHSHIDTHLISYLDIDDLRNVYQVNKYYQNLLKGKLTNFIEFYSKINTIKLSTWIEHNKLFINAIKFGKLDVCQYIHKKYNIDILHIDSDYAFRMSCENGNFDIAKWLFSLGNVNIHALNDYAFRYSCQNGHLNVAKWLFSLGNVNIHAENDYAFHLSCQNGHLNVAKWLFSLDNVDIHYCNDYAFRYSCQNGHLNVAKWLFSFGNVDIHTYNDYAFRWSCERSHINMAKWLCSIEPRYQIEVINNKIKYTIKN